MMKVENWSPVVFVLLIQIWIGSGCVPQKGEDGQQGDSLPATIAPSVEEGTTHVVEILNVSYRDGEFPDGRQEELTYFEEPDLVTHFMAIKREDMRIWISPQGKDEVHILLFSGRAKPGLNRFAFEVTPLPSGLWSLIAASEAGADTLHAVHFKVN